MDSLFEKPMNAPNGVPLARPEAGGKAPIDAALRCRLWWELLVGARVGSRMRKVLVTAVISALVALGCHSSKAPQVASALEGLPEYTPEEAAVFDDKLSAAIFGQRAEVEPSKDPNLNARVTHADWVGRARVSTISRETLAGKDGYTLGVSPDGQPVAGAHPAVDLELRVPRGSPSFTRLEMSRDALIGKRLVIFVRKYADRGEATNHWHGDVDDPSVLAAIEHQKSLDARGTRPQAKD
jgi:hypothetical protein